MFIQEEPKIHELQLHLRGAHEGDCKKPQETLTASHRNILLLFYQLACDEEIIHLTTYRSSEIFRQKIFH